MDGVKVYLKSSDEEVARAIAKTVKDEIQYAPCAIVIDSPYAKALEEGTRPANKKLMHQVDEFGRTPAQRIEAWTNTRFMTMSPQKRKQLSYLIYRKIMEKGTIPHPFIRPAVRDTLRMLDKNWFKNGKSMHDLAEKMANRMKYNLRNDPETGDSHIYTYALYDSIHVMYTAVGDGKEIKAKDAEDDETLKRELKDLGES